MSATATHPYAVAENFADGSGFCWLLWGARCHQEAYGAARRRNNLCGDLNCAVVQLVGADAARAASNRDLIDSMVRR